MIQNAKQIGGLGLLCALFVFLVPLHLPDLHETDLEAANAKTIDQVMEKRKNFFDQVRGRGVNKLVNILIVPGHDDENWGTEFRGVKEVELNRELAGKIYDYLSKEEGINVVLASDKDGYNPIFERYFEREKDRIENFIERSKSSFSKRIRSDDLVVEKNFHNAAPESAAYRLYGINRWINLQDFDLVIHVHFNDYRGRKWNKAGEHYGFSIYTPGGYFDNHDLSRLLADSVFGELEKVRPVSTLESEQEGVIEDHELIALGANESLEAGSILVEYGYIYEDLLTDPAKREVAFDNFAYATYAGVKDLLGERPVPRLDEIVDVAAGKTTIDNLKWQFQKSWKGEYPPEGKDLHDCPISGYFGACSREAQRGD